MFLMNSDISHCLNTSESWSKVLAAAYWRQVPAKNAFERVTFDIMKIYQKGKKYCNKITKNP